MKKSIYLLFALLFTASIFITSPAKAQDQPCQGADPVSGGCPTPGGGSSNLPINSGVIYLMIAGAVIGIIVVKRQEATTLKA